MIWRILKNKNKKAKTLLVVLFLVFCFNFLQTNVAKAIDVGFDCQCYNGSQPIGELQSFFGTDKCSNACKAAGADSYQYDKGKIIIIASDLDKAAQVKGIRASEVEKQAAGNEDNFIVTGFKFLLVGVFNLVGFLFAIASTLFSWVVDPSNVSGDNGLLNKQAVKDVWVMVRDLLNMSFIMVLLFAAFGTIFQLDKWNLKKVWLNILIYALLVNFSYPIARIIIDISNVAFYYLLNNLFSPNGDLAVNGNTIFAGFGNSSSIGELLMPGGYSQYSVAYLIASIIFLFIMGMTLMVIAGLFLVRLIALTMLVMFSPIGFVGYAIPSMSKHADDWWKKLFNYSFFAPIMIFVMNISLRILEALRSENFTDMVRKSSSNTPADMVQWIANAAFFAIPIIILWGGIGIAKSSGIAGADAVLKGVKKWGNNIANIPLSGAKMGWRATGVPGGVKQAKDYYAKRGVKLPGFNGRHFGSDQTEESIARRAESLGVPNAYTNNLLKRMGDAAKENNMEDLDSAVLKNMINTGSEAERLAAIEQLAKNGDIEEPDLKSVIAEFGEKSQIGKRILSKVKEKSPHLAIDYITDGDPDKQRAKREKFAKGFKMENLNNDALGSPEFMKLMISTGKMDKKAIDGLTDKERKTYESTVEKIVGGLGASSTDMSNSVSKNSQLQRLALTGYIHSSIATRGHADHDNARKSIWNKLNKDTAGKLQSSTIDNYYDEIAENVNSGNFVEIVKSISDDTLKQDLISKIMNHQFATASNGDKLKKQIKKDSYLRSFI